MTTAVYFDLENVMNFNLSALMRDLERGAGIAGTDGGGEKNIITIKLAAGNASSITSCREQLKDENFTILEVPHLVNKKNRADLVLSVEAMNDALTHTPQIERFVFISSDSDYTVIIEKLHRTGRETWLVSKAEDKEKNYFKTCTDRIVSIEEYNSVKNTIEDLKTLLRDNGFIDTECSKLVDCFKDGEWKEAKNLNLTLNYNNKKLKNQKALFTRLVDEFFLEKKKKGSTNIYRLAVI